MPKQKEQNVQKPKGKWEHRIRGKKIVTQN